jgi:predicted nucleic acid-binding protein
VSSPPAIIDTNVVVSGFLTSDPEGPTAWILDGMLAGRFPFLLSVDLLAEYRSVLLRPAIRQRHKLSNVEIDAVLTEIAANGQVREVASGLLERGDGDEHLRALLTDRPDSVLVTGDEVLRRRLAPGRSVSRRDFRTQRERNGRGHHRGRSLAFARDDSRVGG